MAQATNQGAVRVRVLVANQAGNGHTIDCFLFSSVIAEVLAKSSPIAPRRPSSG